MMNLERRLATICLVGAAVASAAKVCDFECTTAPSINSATIENEFCANAWNPEPTGFQCLDVAADAASFQADWHWTGGAPFAVHSFPHVNLHSARMPVKLANITKANVAVNWGMGPNETFPAGNTLVTDAAALDATKTMATIAYDLWIDEDPDVASSAAEAKYEIMIWVGHYGNPQPISDIYPSVPKGTITVDKQAFTLYVGKNAVGQTVCSWVLDVPSTNFKLDIVPLIADLVKKELIPAAAYLGGVHFGVEAFYSAETMAFVAKDYTLAISDTRGADVSTSASGTPTSGTHNPAQTIDWAIVTPSGQAQQSASTTPSAASQSLSSRVSVLQLCGCVVAGWLAAYAL
ncbi:concanavalin A-like lectin/glucanase domain-containing protein [Microdochium trichocladiopsis]|uniref:Concanavalin A-like lectin/glucanase domain-containing protein n=1 Tax=Microdochium trichocladiopsis TaxID=1682393 RepID=A0A9P8Y7Q8_9PEZI|nr:concanavalin A-like lectin/glucanase domain-containing protein [Microdochium trichocladiopsis]KAH7031690.1 concanavalin A-like lectin/glucanase domain-containing protein [Microdochium trichocladiopsis]